MRCFAGGFFSALCFVVAYTDLAGALDSEVRAPRATKGDDRQPAEPPPSDVLPEKSRSQEQRTELAEALFERGMALAKKKRHEAALADFDLAAKLDPEMVLAHVGRALCFAGMHRYGEAAEAIRVAIRLRPEDPNLHGTLGNYLVRTHEYDAAVESVTQAIELGRRDAPTYCCRAVALYHSGKYQECIDDFDEALRLRPHDGSTYAARAAGYWKLRRYDRAIEDYDRAIELAPSLRLRFARFLVATERGKDEGTMLPPDGSDSSSHADSDTGGPSTENSP